MFKLGTLADARHEGVENMTVNGACSNCGACCSNHLPISTKETKTIERYIRKHHIQEQKVFLPAAKGYADWSCPFRSAADKTCLIYPVRPAVCREFQCNQSPEKISANKKMFHKKYGICMMRETFFPKD